jgi:hypothetical protein
MAMSNRCTLPTAAPVKIGAPSQTRRAEIASGNGVIDSVGSSHAV